VDNLQEHLARFNDLFYDLEPFLTKKQNKKLNFLQKMMKIVKIRNTFNNNPSTKYPSAKL
jgi:hypothetical protein